MGDFRKLEAWRAAQQLAVEIYRLTTAFPASERYGLTAQMRRAASSIGANLAEGCGRRRDTELRRFARISLGSANELESHVLLASELGLLNPASYGQLDKAIHQIEGQLVSLIRSLSPKSHPAKPKSIHDVGPGTRDLRPET